MTQHALVEEGKVGCVAAVKVLRKEAGKKIGGEPKSGYHPLLPQIYGRRMYYSKTIRCLALFLAVSLLGVSGSATAQSQLREGDTSIRTIEIVAKDFRFEPSNVSIQPGERVRVRVTNQGSVGHTFHIAGQGLKTEPLEPGRSDTFVLDAPQDGRLEFFCDVQGHKGAGMTGMFVVR